MRSLPGPVSRLISENQFEEKNDSKFERDFKDIHDIRYLFESQSWLKLCKFFDISFNLEVDKQNELLKKFNCCLQFIIDGMFDFRTSRLAVVIESIKESFDGSWIISLRDLSARINAIASKDTIRQFPELLQIGTALVIQNASIIISKCPFERVICIDEENVLVLFSAVKSKTNTQNMILINDNENSDDEC